MREVLQYSTGSVSTADFVGVWKVNDEIAGSGAGSIGQRHGSADLYPY
jgi:hypothetical protein